MSTMYSLKPVFDLDAKVEVPSCMYSLPVIQASQPILGIGVCSDKAAAPGTEAAIQAIAARQDAILARLGQLKDQVNAYKQSLGLPPVGDTQQQVNVSRTADLVIRCSPSSPALSLPAVFSMLIKSGLSVHTSSHTHSSIIGSLDNKLASLLPVTDVARSTAQVRLTLIWTEVAGDCELMVSPLTQTVIKGEANMLRYLARLFPSVLSYEINGPHLVDSLLDSVASLGWVVPRSRQPLLRSMANQLSNGGNLTGPSLTIADLALYSALQNLNLVKELQPELSAWFNTMDSKFGVVKKENTSPVNKNQKNAKAPVKDVKNEKSSSKTPVKDVKKEFNSSKTPAKDAKSPVKKVGKSTSKRKTGSSTDLDVSSNNNVGSRFTKQWPEIKHIFQYSALQLCLNNLIFVSEKFDGSNIALTTQRVVASRRNILLNKPSREELEKSKFSGVALGKLAETFICLNKLKDIFETLFPFLTTEVIVYGELIQKGTATCKIDKFNYRQKGHEAGDFLLFGSGISFRENLTSKLLESALEHLRSHKFNAILNNSEDSGNSHLVLLMNDKLEETLVDCGFNNIIKYRQLSLIQMVDEYLPRLLKSEIEGIVINFGTEIVKWKGVDDCYPDMFVQQIVRLKESLDSRVHTALLQVALESIQKRSSKNVSNTDVLLEQAYVSAMSKMVTANNDIVMNTHDKKKRLDQYEADLLTEMMNDCCGSEEFRQRLPAFIKSKIPK